MKLHRRAYVWLRKLVRAPVDLLLPGPCELFDPADCFSFTGFA
jgi:hypothetical protein